MRGKMLAVLGALTLAASSVASAQSLGVPDAPTIAKLEAAVQLPPGAQPLASYQRYYAYVGKPGHLLVAGAYVARGGLGNVHLVASADLLPDIADGGCSVVYLWWDVATGKTIGAACNGNA
jgi:hypothetical protein